ncbi:MAG: DUF2891 domain-containing protein [Bacteroidota bacterium]
MKYLTIVFLSLLFACNSSEEMSTSAGVSSERASSTLPTIDPITLDLGAANNLAELPLACIEQEFPNKLGQVIGSAKDLDTPSRLHPAFFGCFDWHSAVHGHWSLVALLTQFPDLNRAEVAKQKLTERLSAENITAEVAYFLGPLATSYERTYGWAWLLQLQKALNDWQDPIAPALAANLQPLSDLIVQRYHDYLPKLVYPIRTGEHPNTAFGLSFAWDYAQSTGDSSLKHLIAERARDFFQKDVDASFAYEPSGYDFLSPILEEVDIMRRVLPAQEFHAWLAAFVPEIVNPDFELAVGEVRDRTDGKLVHLDGLNFSRAWVFYSLAKQYPRYGHLVAIANQHVNYSLPNLVDDAYEGGHWLGSFAIYALQANR